MQMFTRRVAHSKHAVIAAAMTYGAAFCILAALSTAASHLWAQTVIETPWLAQSSTKVSSSDVPVKNSTALALISKLTWQDLTQTQKASLKPLAANWKTLSAAQQRKWIAIAANYPGLTPVEQVKLHNRMTEWVSLSPQQRAQARLNFARAKQLNPTQKTATWKAYQALSPEEKKKLAIAAVPKPAGAAAATKPVPPQKLSTVPVTRHIPKQPARIASPIAALHRNTLLPRSQAPVAPPHLQKNSTPKVLPE